MILLYAILALTGIIMTIDALGDLNCYGSLFFMRNYYCIERFRKAQKATDVVSCVHNAAKCLFAFLALSGGVGGMLHRDLPLDGIWIAGAVLLLVDAAVAILITRAYHLREERDAIQAQWDRQKRVSKDNDHEVNMYRGATRVLSAYPKTMAAMAAGLILMAAWVV